MENKLNCHQYLKEKKELIKTFLTLTKKEQQALAAKDYDLLLELLVQKDMVMTKINQIDGCLGAFKEHENQPMDDLKKEIVDLLNSAKEIAGQNKNVLEKELESTAQHLKKTRSLRKTHSLYKGDQIPIGGILIDKKK